MKKRGQALVEFVIILPILLLILMGIMDMGRIYYTKITLEDEISDVVSLYDKGLSDNDIKDKLELGEEKIKLDTKVDGEFKEVILTKDIDILTPGLNLIFDNPYVLKVSRSIIND